MKNKARAVVCAALLTLVCGCLPGCVKIIEKGTEDQYTGRRQFDAQKIADDLWDDILQEYDANAVDLGTLLSASNGKWSEAAKQYGVSGKPNFQVKGQAEVESVDTSKASGFLNLKLDGYAGDMTVRLQIGPTFKNKDAVGDCQTVTGYKDYTNQTEWGQVKDALISIVSQKVLSDIAADSLKGKTIQFTGAFAAQTGSKDIMIIPLSLQIQ